MIAQRYGTLPIVRYTGGLRDTVKGYDGEKVKDADGIGFNDYNETGLDYAFALSRKLSKDPSSYYEAARNAMALDRSWSNSAEIYLGIYREIALRH